jgi:hypothetical protein
MLVHADAWPSHECARRPPHLQLIGGGGRHHRAERQVGAAGADASLQQQLPRPQQGPQLSPHRRQQLVGGAVEDLQEGGWVGVGLERCQGRVGLLMCVGWGGG